MEVSLENAGQRVKRIARSLSAASIAPHVGAPTTELTSSKQWTYCDKLRPPSNAAPPPLTPLHRVLAKLFRADLLEPFLELLLVRRLGGQVHGLRLVEHPLQDEDRRIRAQREGDGIAGPRIDDQILASLIEVEG